MSYPRTAMTLADRCIELFNDDANPIMPPQEVPLAQLEQRIIRNVLEILNIGLYMKVTIVTIDDEDNVRIKVVEVNVPEVRYHQRAHELFGDGGFIVINPSVPTPTDSEQSVRRVMVNITPCIYHLHQARETDPEIAGLALDIIRMLLS